MSNVKPKRIICVVGRSGVGKTTWMEHFRKYAYVVSSRTIRLAREGEVHGEAPYHKFLSANDYLSDAIVDGLVTTGNLSRGDDIILADTQFGDDTYWAKISDILSPTAFNGEDSIIDENLVFYIIDPVGVANLYDKQKKIAQVIDKYGFTPKQAPLLFAFRDSTILSAYVSADKEIMDKVSEKRRARDNAQDLGWRLIDGMSPFRFHIDYVEDEMERMSYLSIFSIDFIHSIMHHLGYDVEGVKISYHFS